MTPGDLLSRKEVSTKELPRIISRDRARAYSLQATHGTAALGSAVRDLHQTLFQGVSRIFPREG